MKFCLALFVFVAALPGFCQDSIKNVLIIGDSHLKGHFGEHLHRTLNDKKTYDVMSIAIGGAGSQTFFPKMQNLCCGYRVRESCAGTVIPEKGNVPVLERAEKPTGYILKNYSASLKNVLCGWQPDAIIIVLGSNWLNAHQQLLDTIKTFDSLTPVIWVGPFDKREKDGRYTAIETAMKNYRQATLIKGCELLGTKVEKVTHFSGKKAKTLASSIIEKSEPFIDLKIKERKLAEKIREIENADAEKKTE
jgi:hypothetical protein